MWDAFGRLKQVKRTDNQNLVTEYRYNGLGHRIGWHYTGDGDETVEDISDVPWFSSAYDNWWRIVANHRGSDSSPKEAVHLNQALFVDGVLVNVWLYDVRHRNAEIRLWNEYGPTHTNYRHSSSSFPN